MIPINAVFSAALLLFQLFSQTGAYYIDIICEPYATDGRDKTP